MPDDRAPPDRKDAARWGDEDPDRPPDVRGIFKVWVDSDLKVQVLVFFHQNPGVIETLEGLAQRLGMNPQALRDEIADHIRLGIIKEREIGNKKILVYNRTAEQDVADMVQREIEHRMDEDDKEEATS